MNCGGNSFIWILLILLLIPGGFGSCGNSCGSCGDSSMLILLLFIIMFSGNGIGICEAK